MFQKCFKDVKKEVSKYLKGIPMLFYKTSKVGSRIFYKLFQERMSQNVLKEVSSVSRKLFSLFRGWVAVIATTRVNKWLDE